VRLFPVALVLLLAWGALAVGGSPTWAGVPVAVFAVATALLGLIEGRPFTGAGGLRHRAVAVPLAVLLASVAAQLIPLPRSVVAQLSPSRDAVDFERLLTTADRRDPGPVSNASGNAPRPLSIAPTRTWFGLGFLAAFALLVLGASGALSIVGVTSLSRAIAILGVVVAFLGIYQTTTTTDGLYSIYVPLSPVHRSAPFINRNHQAGWLAMVLALTLGAFAGELARGMRGIRPNWRDRLLWFSGRDANVALLLLFASLVVAIGILTSRSRSGAGIMLLTFMAFAAVTGLKQPSRIRRTLATFSVILVAGIVIVTSASPVLVRLAETSWTTLDGRLPLWSDSARILADFQLTGTGFNTYGVSMLHYQTLRDGYRYIEAHNDYLQMAIEGGLLVGLPFLLVLVVLVAEIRRRFREAADDTRTYWIRMGAVIGLAVIAAQSVVDFTLQMPGAAAMAATLLAIAMHHPRPRASAPRGSHG